MSSRYYDAEDDDHRHGRSSRYSVDGPPSYYSSGALPAPPLSQARLQYEPQTPLYASNTLRLPDSRGRPRSVPPPTTGPLTRRRRSASSSTSSRDRSRSPLGKARHAVRDSFTDSSAGLGVGILGAIVGGLAAREVSDATARRRHNQYHEKSQDSGDHQKTQLITTLIGAAVGGLGANALERRLEDNRQRDREKQAAWEQKWRPNDKPRRDASRHGRPRRRGTADDYYNVEDGYDYVYDRKISRTRSDDGFSHE